MKKIILIDAHAIIHRAFHALPPLSTPSGDPINAVYGFTTILLRILKEFDPEYIAAAFDLPGPTFRHVAYERYKAHRPEAPSELVGQFSKVREVLHAFGIPVFQKEGYEADDIIGTIVKKLEKQKGLEIIIITGDMDTLQLVRPNVKVYSMRRGISDIVLYDEEAVRKRFGFGPKTLIDYKGLRGDPSDNIPGVKGIGEKIAKDLLKKYGSIEAVYRALKAKNSKKFSPAIAEKLRRGEEDAKISKMLATINTRAPIEFKLEDAARPGKGRAVAEASHRERIEKIRALFENFGFVSLLRQLTASESNPRAERAPGTSVRESKKHSASVPLPFAAGGSTLPQSAIIVAAPGRKPVLLGDAEFSSPRITPALQTLLNDTRLIVSDSKAFVRYLDERGAAYGAIEFDLILAAYVVNAAARDFSLYAISRRALPGVSISGVEDIAEHFFDIVASLRSKLKEGRLEIVFREIELPLAPILARMETRGILLDGAFLSALGVEASKRLARLKGEIYERAGGAFNINSPQQLSVVLFKKLGLSHQGLRKTEKGGAVSTSASELEKLKSAHPIVRAILEYRELHKLKTTYIDVLPTLIDSKDGRIHTTFNQVGTETGRLSSANPNLQNIPIMSEFGRKIRRAFVASPGFDLVCFDYSQIELRVAAHLANDRKMIETFKKGLDVHTMTAAEINHIPIERVTPELRRAAKTLNFGVLYGMGANALAEAAGMPLADARAYIQEYFRDFSGIKEYIERTKAFAEEHGYVETLFGRRRYIPEIHTSAFRVRRDAERVAINMPIQGSATGDMIKMAMRDVSRWIEKERCGQNVRMLLQVHDELVFEIKKEMTKKYAPQIKKIMERVAALNVPLVVDVKSGQNWEEQTPLW